MTEKYRIEAGQFVGQVDVADGVIVAAPNVWRKFVGSPLHRLEWWLARCNQSCSKIRMPIAETESLTVLSEVVLPTYCGCNELLVNIDELEAHVERGCWRKASGS